MKTTTQAIHDVVIKRRGRGASKQEIYQYLNSLKATWGENESILRFIDNLKLSIRNSERY